VAELHKELLESQNQRDKRIEGLWRTLGPNKKGELDLKGLQKGLRKIDHRKLPGNQGNCKAQLLNRVLYSYGKCGWDASKDYAVGGQQ